MNNNRQMQPWNDTESRGDSREMVVRTTSEIYDAAAIEVFRNTIHAAMTKEAMDHTARLAMLEEFHTRNAPTGKNEYRKLVEAYAEGAIRRIGGFR